MKVIIEVKDTATLSRIDELDKRLSNDFRDVITSISKEW